MIEMQYNFPLLPEQGTQWQQRLAAAVAGLLPADADQLRPTFRQHLDHRSIAAHWLGSDPERTLLTVGGHHGTLVALLAAQLAGKPIAVESVTYTGILEQAAMLNCPLIALDYDAEGMTPGSLRAACESPQRPAALYTMPTVHNPLGAFASLARRQAILALAREFDLLLIEDDAYGYMAPDAPPNFSVLAPERTFYVRGLSKSYAPATRTGFLVAPPQFVSAADRAIRNSTTGTALPHNIAVLSLIADGSLDALIQHKLTAGAQRNAAARAILGDAATPGAPSAWHLWITWPDHLDAPSAQRLCEERGVLVSGAQGFTVPGTQPPKALRVALGGELEPARTLEGVRIVAEVLAS